MKPVECPIDVLVVDLDGTLLRSDMLYESLWSAVGRNPRVAITTAGRLKDGKAAVKRHLAGAAKIDVTLLPYDQDVIAFVQERRALGARTVLMTASDQDLADRIAQHLDLFDEVHGSDGSANLKGEAKSRLIAERYPGQRVGYMGDAKADLPIWSVVDVAIPVNAPKSVRSDIVADEILPLDTRPRPLAAYIRALRPHQWLKNILVFVPMLAGHRIDAVTFGQSLLAFLCFCLVASSVYVLNDLLDLRADREHPRKRLRPFAAGDVPILHGTWMAGGLLLAGVALSLTLGLGFFGVMALYYVATLAYSLNLKRRAVVDICVLAGLYTLRIVAGGAATGTVLTVWLLAFSIFFFFSLAAIKRQAELVDLVARNKLGASGRGYKVEDLTLISMMAVGAGYVSILVMMLYVNSPGVVELYSQPVMLWGICCVLLYWISRIAMLTHRGYMLDDPVVFAVKDRNSRICFVLIVVFALAGSVL